MQYEVVTADAVSWLASQRDMSVDLILLDYAYESLEKHRKRGTTTRLKKSKSSDNAWFEIFPNYRLAELLHELYRVLRPDRHAYLFCDGETSDVLRPIVAAMPRGAAFTWWKRLIWDKGRKGLGYHFGYRHEFIVFLEKGKRKLREPNMDDILPFKMIRGGYPGEKPVPLLKTLIEQSTRPREVVCDPFCGSGSSGVAALELGRRFRGCDIAASAVQLAETRLAAVR